MTQDFWFGAITLGLSLAGLLLEDSWFQYSRIGKTLAHKYGDKQGRRISRSVLLLSGALGITLMLGVLHTLSWKP